MKDFWHFTNTQVCELKIDRTNHGEAWPANHNNPYPAGKKCPKRIVGAIADPSFLLKSK